MIGKLAVLALTLFSTTTGASQDSKDIVGLEQEISMIDSILIAGNNIGMYVHPLFSDDGGQIFLKHHYSIDTTKRILYKAIHDYVNCEEVTFYYYNQKITKVVVNDTSIKTNPYKCEYYFDNDSIVSIKEQGIPNPKNSWSRERVVSQAKQYLTNFAGICDMLDTRR